MPPDVTIIIPCYKAEKYIEQALNSVIAQSLENIQIIAIDDCSPDRTGDVILRFMKLDPRVQGIFQPENGGVSVARNTGIDAAAGKYVSFLDADDKIDSDFCRHLHLLAESQEADIVACNFQRIENNGISKPFFKACNPPVAFSGREYAGGLQYAQFFDNCWSKLYRRKFLNDNNLRFNSNLKFGEDTLFANLAAAKANRIAIDCSYSGYLYYNNPQSCMNTIELSNRIRNLSDLLQSLKSNIESSEEKLLLRKSLEYVWTIKKYGGKDRIPLLEKMVKDSVWSEIVLPITLKYGKLKHRIAARLLDNGFYTAINFW